MSHRVHTCSLQIYDPREEPFFFQAEDGIRDYKVTGVQTCALPISSAVREARNGLAFVRRLRRETGLPVKVITGAEEARLIFRAAQHALGLRGGPHLLLDVGGGSVELVLVQQGRPLWLRSLPLGAARL